MVSVQPLQMAHEQNRVVTITCMCILLRLLRFLISVTYQKYIQVHLIYVGATVHNFKKMFSSDHLLCLTSDVTSRRHRLTNRGFDAFFHSDG